MTQKWGRMATYPIGDSQLSLQEERPHGETPHSMRVYVPSPNRPYPWSGGARNLGLNREKSLTKLSTEKQRKRANRRQQAAISQQLEIAVEIGYFTDF